MNKKIKKMLILGLVSITLGISGFGGEAKAVTSTGSLDGTYCSASLYTIGGSETVEGDLTCTGAVLNINVSNKRWWGSSYYTFYGNGTGNYTGSYAAYANNGMGGSVFVSGTGSFKATQPSGSQWVRNLSI